MFIHLNYSFSEMTILYGDTPTPTLESDVFSFFCAFYLESRCPYVGVWCVMKDNPQVIQKTAYTSNQS